MTLVTFAVPFESAAFRRHPISRTVQVLHTGVGGEAARATLEQALCGELPDRVIAAGFAGALVPELGIGEIVGEPAGPGIRAARFACSAAVLTTAAEKETFRQRTGATAVDMETDVIREVCAVAGVPLRILRVISDRAEDDLGLPADLLEALSRHPLRATPRLAWTLLTETKRRRRFLRLVRDCRAAQQSLAAALVSELARTSGPAVG